MTQALAILKNKRINFNGTEHHIFFSNMTTSLVKAESLAREIGMEFDRDTHSTNKLDFNQTVGGLNFGGDFAATFSRLKNDSGYTKTQASMDLLKHSGSSWKAVSTTSACTAAVCAAVGVSTGAVALPATIAVATAVSGLGKDLFQAWLPDQYNRITKNW